MEPQEAISGWEPGSEARRAAQRTHSGNTGRRRIGLLAAGWGPTSARELRPASDTVQGSRPPGGSGVAAGSSGGDVSMAPEPGSARSWVLCGAGRGGGEGGGNLAGRRAAVSTCLLPAPLPQNRFGQSGVQEGGWNNGSPMPRRGSEGPQTDVLKMGEALLFCPRNSSPLF